MAEIYGVCKFCGQSKIKVGIKYANDSIAITRTDTNKQSDKAVK